MPTSGEVIPNRPLSGTELRHLIVADVEDLLDKDGLFAPHIGYGRVAYEVRVTLHLDNFTYPEHKTHRASEPPPPLKNPSKEAVVRSVERSRKVVSPNATRVDSHLPVTVTRQDAHGHLVDEQVTYGPEDAEVPPESAPPPVDADLTRMVKQDWGQLDQPVGEVKDK